MNNFKNKNVLITGSSKGIGRATALLFAKQGANVIINYLHSAQEAKSLENELMKLGSKSITIMCDISNEDQVKEMFSLIEKKYKKIDVLVNNAAFVKDVPILERSVEDWKRTLDVNLLGYYLCTKYAAKIMLNNSEGGTIINIASTSAHYSFSPDIVDYDVSKAGVIVLTKDFAKALAPKVRVNAVSPGWVNTDINKNLSIEFKESEKSNIFLKRFAEPEEIGNIILFLAGDDSSFINGSVLVADGGHD